MTPEPHGREPHPVGRRLLLHLGVAGAVAAVAAACGQAEQPPESGRRRAGRNTSTGSPTTSSTANPSAAANARVLVAYFSRPGESYYYGDRTWLEVGNTEVVATIIAELIDCDIHRIEAADPYPADYEETVARNVREQDDDARPGITNPLPDIDQYDSVLLGSPIWNVRAPIIMSTFTEALDFTGKTVHPFTTYAMSGLGTTEADYAETCPGATIGHGVAIQGERANAAAPELATWLQQIGLGTGR